MLRFVSELFEEGEEELLCNEIDNLRHVSLHFAIGATLCMLCSIHLLPFLQVCASLSALWSR